MTETKTGALDIFNVNKGHLEFRFNKEDTIERERAKRCIEGMLKAGYALFIEMEDGTHAPVRRFDAKHGVYYISDVPTTQAPIGSTVDGPEPGKVHEHVAGMKKRGRPRKGIPMERARVTAVGRTAGG